MADSDLFDNTSADHEQLEIEHLAQDRDTASVATADIDDAMTRSLIDDLIDADIVTPFPEDQVLVHEPSRTALDSTTNWPSSTGLDGWPGRR